MSQIKFGDSGLVGLLGKCTKYANFPSVYFSQLTWAAASWVNQVGCCNIPTVSRKFPTSKLVLKCIKDFHF